MAQGGWTGKQFDATSQIKILCHPAFICEMHYGMSSFLSNCSIICWCIFHINIHRTLYHSVMRFFQESLCMDTEVFSLMGCSWDQHSNYCTKFIFQSIKFVLNSTIPIKNQTTECIVQNMFSATIPPQSRFISRRGNNLSFFWQTDWFSFTK